MCGRGFLLHRKLEMDGWTAEIVSLTELVSPGKYDGTEAGINVEDNNGRTRTMIHENIDGSNWANVLEAAIEQVRSRHDPVEAREDEVPSVTMDPVPCVETDWEKKMEDYKLTTEAAVVIVDLLRAKRQSEERLEALRRQQQKNYDESDKYLAPFFEAALARDKYLGQGIRRYIDKMVEVLETRMPGCNPTSAE